MSEVIEDQAPYVDGEYQHSLIDLEAANPNEREFDNLYIDMNGIIHPCTHPEDGEAPKTEEEMCIKVMHYVDRLVAAVRPRRLLYLAIKSLINRRSLGPLQTPERQKHKILNKYTDVCMPIQ